jgi:hypothetical protein
MPRETKGARLYLRKGRTDSKTGQALPDVWVIRDGNVQRSTGCGPDSRGEAEKALAEYIAGKWAPEARSAASRSDPAQVTVDDVVALYAEEKAPKTADPVATGVRLSAILDWWTGKTLSEVTRSNCAAYVEHRCTQPIRGFKDPKKARNVTPQGARRELEDLSSAIGWWDAEHHLTRRPKVILPEKPESPRDALSRSQAAALLWAAMGWRKLSPEESKKQGRTWVRLGASARANRAHLRRFVLLGLYSGSRPGVAPKLLWVESPQQAWVDLEKGWIYRRGKAERDHKTKRRPLIRIPRRLLAHMERWARLDAKLNEERRKKRLEPVTTVLHHGGAPLTGKIRRGFAGIVADAGLDGAISPHWMRHTAATWLMERNVDLLKAAQYLGMTVATLEKHYGHHRPDYQSDVLDAVGRGGR